MNPEEKRKELHTMLQKAVQLEFSTIPPYLTAAFSIHPDANRSSYEIIHSVYMEEMLHMALAANVLNAIGGTVKLNENNIPTYPFEFIFKGKKFKKREFKVNLERFCKNSIQTFMDIELPDGWDEPLVKTRGMRVEVDGYTIGEFYNSIKKKLNELCDELTEREVFNGDPEKQISKLFYWSGGGSPFEVRYLKDALDAIDVIVEQGEGANLDSVADGDSEFFGMPEEVAHFFRFNEIFVGKKYKIDDNPRKPPTGEDMLVEWDRVFPTKMNCTQDDFKNSPKLAALNTKFNQHYTLMVKSLEEALNGQIKSLYPAIMNDMHGMAEIALQMVQIPINGDESGQTGSPSFELISLTHE